jgi:hypothetical protein
MKFEEIKLYQGKFGLLIWKNKKGKLKDTKMYHGIIKYIDEDIILFRIQGMPTRTITIDSIISFEEKIMNKTPI